MTDKEKRKAAISELQYAMNMMCFNPLTGEVVLPDQLRDENRKSYDACLYAIELLTKEELRPITSEKELDEYIESFRGEATVWIEQKRTYPGNPLLFPATLVKHNERRPEDPNYYDLRAEYYLVRESIGILWRAWIRKPSFERIEEVAWVA